MDHVASKLPALQLFVDGMRATWTAGLDEPSRWAKAAEMLQTLLRDKALGARAADWPSSLEKTGYSNLLFYQDAEHGFVLNGLVKPPGAASPIHDHGDTWTVYGVLSGIERIVHYEHGDGTAPFRELADYKGAPGFVDVVPPGRIHAEIAGPGRTVALIVRSRKVGDFLQNMYDPSTGVIDRRPGPVQRPFALV